MSYQEVQHEEVGEVEGREPLNEKLQSVFELDELRKPCSGQCLRDDLFNINAGIVHTLCEGVARCCSNALVTLISNPVNSTVPIAAEVFKKAGTYNPRRLLGVTTLDVVRANTFVVKPPSSFTPEEVAYLMGRIQNRGTEVVEVLLVIIPSKDLVLCIDPKVVEDRVFAIESHFLKAYRQYLQWSGRAKGKETCDWSMFQGPQQISDWECGYYVMKNMDFIIRYLTRSFPDVCQFVSVML
ncbi:malate dehydrogenase [Carex littledalei]|uniref:Malate dehydrogenase n=1 Tax=Carex littledalei TaxID=544730 RepID=A0A833VRP4_9POAL|nr:malate dehydrogenase [Carex littledalei]